MRKIVPMQPADEEREQVMDEFLRNYRSKVRTQMVEMEKAVGTLKRSGMR